MRRTVLTHPRSTRYVERLDGRGALAGYDGQDSAFAQLFTVGVGVVAFVPERGVGTPAGMPGGPPRAGGRCRRQHVHKTLTARPGTATRLEEPPLGHPPRRGPRARHRGGAQPTSPPQNRHKTPTQFQIDQFTSEARVRSMARKTSVRFFARFIQPGNRAMNVIFFPDPYQGARSRKGACTNCLMISRCSGL